jgi:hypothetical protein
VAVGGCKVAVGKRVAVGAGRVEVGTTNVGMLVVLVGIAGGVVVLAGLQADKTKVTIMRIGKTFLDDIVSSYW